MRCLLALLLILPSLAWSAITFRSYTAKNADTNGSVVMTKPAGTAVGDVLIFQMVSVPGAIGTISPPTGWTLIDAQTYGSGEGSADYYRVVDGSEGSTFTWTWTGGLGRGVMILAAFSGVDNTTPIHKHSLYYGTTSNTSMPTTSITPTVNNTMIVVMFGTNFAYVITAPSGMTNIYNSIDGGNGYSGEMSYLLQGTAAATSPTATSATAISNNQTNLLIALNPAGGGGGATPFRHKVVSW